MYVLMVGASSHRAAQLGECGFLVTRRSASESWDLCHGVLWPLPKSQRQYLLPTRTSLEGWECAGVDWWRPPRSMSQMHHSRLVQFCFKRRYWSRFNWRILLFPVFVPTDCRHREKSVVRVFNHTPLFHVHLIELSEGKEKHHIR